MSFVTLEDYTRFTGATVATEQTQAALDAACAEIQLQLGQRIEFVMNDVISVHGTGRPFLLLPEMPIVAVDEIWIDKDLDTERQVDDFRVLAEDGIVYWWEHWPRGINNVTVDYSHGYQTIPADIINVAVQAARTATGSAQVGEIVSETIGGYSYTVSAAAAEVTSFAHVLSRYRIKRVPVP